jgi:hypothetical protein
MEQPMVDPRRAERLQIMLDPEELAALDDWRFANRMPSRAAAVRELLNRGLTAEANRADPNGKRSRDFAVINRKPNGDGKSNGSDSQAD